ncbi:MAG: FAD-dependent monooxygenase [Nakamurella sp.]
MGLKQAIREATTGEQGTRFVRDDGSLIAEFPAGTSDSDGATAELEILRGDLARLLVDRSESVGADHRWGDSITGLRQDDDLVTVSFECAGDEDFDLGVAADGIGSSTRALVFGDEPTIRSLGLTTSWLTIPRTKSDDDWWRWYTAPAGRSVTLRPWP